METNEEIHESSSLSIFLPRGLYPLAKPSLFFKRGITELVHPNIAPADTQQRFAEMTNTNTINLPCYIPWYYVMLLEAVSAPD